ncbi:MAG TPA: acyl-CoA carboxylase subunit beta [Lachnospiraceae bacterium]|nr:acyl-CoA carboxylase subunit beta [Lachnospiraceae bacterium]
MTEKNVDELEVRINRIHGTQRAEKQHSAGKMSAWERIMLLVDEGSFVETNVFLEHRCSYFGMDQRKEEGDGVITGYGTINGRCVCIYAQDFTVFGGSISEMNARKISDIQKKALDMLVPIVGLFDSGGARVQEGIQSLSGHGHIFYNNVKASGKIPQISAIMGTCAGGASYSPALTDFIVMVDKTSNMFITGPKVVKAAIGQDVSMEELGGTLIHSQISGMADHVARDDQDCIVYIKELLSYLPDSYVSIPPKQIHFKYNQQKKNQIQAIVPKSGRIAYDVLKVIECIVDDGTILEIKKEYATNIVTLLARMEGQTIGIVANQSSQKAGCIDIDAADKAARFVRLCDNFSIPILNLVDVSGFYPGKEQEQKGIIRHGAKMLFAYSEAEVLKITVILRKAYGGAYLAMCSKELGADMVFAWPNAEMAVMSADAAINVLYKNADEKEKENRLAEYKERFLNPFEAAHMGYVDEIIEPAATRAKVCQVLRSMGGCKQNKVTHPHGNIPL